MAKIRPGGSTFGQAILRDAAGDTLRGRSVTWTSSAPLVAAVDPITGKITGLADGIANIVATSENVSGTAQLSVYTPVASVSVTLGISALFIGRTIQASATTRDERDSVLAGRAVSWSSSDAAVAMVEATTGMVTAHAEGTATIRATSDSVTGEASVTVTRVPVALVTVKLTRSSITEGTATSAEAALRDADSAILTDRVVTWSSSDSTVATVDVASGAVTGKAEGLAQIVATSEGVSGNAALTVTRRPVASISVSLTTSSIVVGASSQASATLRDANNNGLSGRIVVWNSSAPGIATVDASTGVVTAIASGTARIIASSETISGEAVIAVTPIPVALVAVTLSSPIIVGASTIATAVVHDASNNVLTGRAVAWSSSDPAVAVADPVTGAVTGLAPGTANIIATSEAITGQAALVVIPVPVASIAVSLNASTITAGSTTTANAIARDRTGVALSGRAVTWSSAEQAIASIDATTGVVSAVAPGTTEIIATSEGISGHATVTVMPVPVASVTVTLTTSTVVIGTSVTAMAVTRDASNSVLAGRPVRWTSSNPAVATVDSSTGAITAVDEGSSVIRASSEGVTGEATLTVTRIPVDSVVVTLNDSSLVAGTSTSAGALIFDAGNRLLSGRAVAWSSSAPGVAAVDATTGLVTAVAPGTANVIATSEGISGQVALVVIPVPVASVCVTLAAETIIAGASTTAIAVARDVSSGVLSDRAFTWSSSDPAIATVDGITGVVTGVGPGTANIVVTSEGISGQAPLRVIPVPVASLEVTLVATAIIAGTTTNASAVARDAIGNLLMGRAIAWNSSNDGVATVDASSGLVTAIAPGTTRIIASSETISGDAVLTVAPVPVASVTVTLNAATIIAGTSTTAAAVTHDAGNNVLAGRAITWSSSDTGVATIDAITGVVTAVAAGTVNITATSENIQGQASLTVLAQVASVRVTLTVDSIITGKTTTAVVVTRDAGEAELFGRPVTWSSSSAALATVDATTGAVTAVAPGTASIIATSEGISGQADLRVIPAVTSVTVSLNPATIIMGASTTATAVTRDTSNSILTGRPITWSSSDPAVARVDPTTGAVSSVAPGSANIIATSESITGLASLEILPGVASVAVTLSSPIIAGASTTATAVIKDAGNNVLAGREIVWSSSDDGIATVGATTGIVTAVRPGTTEIVASSEGVSGHASVVVIPPVVSVTVTLDDAGIFAGVSTTAVAVTRDAGNDVLTGRNVIWSSSDPGIAIVTGNGVVTGLAPGNVTIIATCEGIAAQATLVVVPPASAVTDPTLLPLATGQHPVAGTYGRDLAANQSYLDPLSGATVLKLTDASVPNANAGVYHGYSEGGPNISLPWVGADGHTYYTAYIAAGWLVDIRLDTFTSSNWRAAPTRGETRFTFSLNPATPRIAYYSSITEGRTINRYNTATNQLANAGIFPYAPSAVGEDLAWLQVNLNDQWLIAMFNSNSTTVAVRLSDRLERIIPPGGHDVDEPHIDREYPVVYVSTNDVQNLVINLETGEVVSENDPNNADVSDHGAPLRGKVVAINWAVDGVVSIDHLGNVTVPVTPSPTDWHGDSHLAGQWVFNNPSEYFILDQWERFGDYPIYNGMIGFVSISGDVRLLAAHDATGGEYETGGQPHPTISPDGKLVMWTSNMNGSGRFDVFVARVPAR